MVSKVRSLKFESKEREGNIKKWAIWVSFNGVDLKNFVLNEKEIFVITVKMTSRIFDVPRIFFTLSDDNPISKMVLQELQGLLDDSAECISFSSAEEIRERFESGLSPQAAVVLVDDPWMGGRKRFRPTTSSRHEEAKVLPYWAYGTQWMVKVGKRTRQDPARCARQIRGDFSKNFSARIGNKMFPWGKPRQHENPPEGVDLPSHMGSVLQSLNSGPDLAAAIADKEFALELPPGSKISWFRVTPEPIGCDNARLVAAMNAFEEFERASSKLIRLDSEMPQASRIQPLISAGVEFPDSLSRAGECYLYPSKNCFSVRRPDLHWTLDGVFASENDEMPGGFAELVHLDRAYGINQDRWKRCFQWLCGEGPLMFLVSHEWSKCYIAEFRWLCEYLQGEDYPVFMLTTEPENLRELCAISNGVFYRGIKLGTIWRQFPIFETTGKLAHIVELANDGVVRLVPEFAHFGNKAWFSIFRSHAGFFKKELGKEAFQMLEGILPDSHLVIPQNGRCNSVFPLIVGGILIENLQALKTIKEENRDNIVLKIVGANTLAARSYGVLMGKGLKQEEWESWICERLRNQQPFLIQRRLESGVTRVPVMNTKLGRGEAFSCRVLLRPWQVGDEVVSVSACAVPSNTVRVHGRVDMAVLPVILE